MEKKIEEKWKDKATLQQVFFILLGTMVGLNGYQGPVFGTWYGDIIIVIAFLVSLGYMRVHDQLHQQVLSKGSGAIALVSEFGNFTSVMEKMMNWITSEKSKSTREVDSDEPSRDIPF